MNIHSMLILSDTGRYAYADVDELTPEERLALLDGAHMHGWEPVLRGVQTVTDCDSKGNPTGVAHVEYWYWRRRSDA